MANLLTPWGYEIEGGTLPDLLTVEEFNALTDDRWASSPIAAATVSAVSAAIRNWCGWHVAPSLSVVAEVYPAGPVVHLPWLAMTAVSEVSHNGVTISPAAYKTRRDGFIIRTDGFIWPSLWEGITVKATAGFPVDAALKQLVVQIAGNALAAPLGVREEHAGQVGITYNSTGTGISGGVALLERDRAALAPYCLAVRA